MKAKNILRISLFAALLCMITILGAFAAEAEPMPIIWRFNSQNVIEKWGTHGWSASPKNIILKDGVAHIDGFSSDAHGITAYTLDIGDGQFSLDDYPYIKYKFRWNNTDDVSTVPYTQFYIYKAAGGSIHQDYHNSTESEWTTASYDMSSVSEYTGDIAATRSIDLWFRHGSAVSTGYAEVEYIAFFPNTEKGKAAWEAFDVVDGAASTVAGTSDKFLPSFSYDDIIDIFVEAQETIDAASTDDIVTVERAKNLMVSALETAIGDSNLTYTVGTPTKNGGIFTIDVTVTCDGGSVTRQLKITTPIIWRFNNEDMIEKWGTHGWSGSPKNIILKDGVAHIDGFSSDAHGITAYTLDIGDGQFSLDEYPYIKYKFRWNNTDEVSTVPYTQFYIYKAAGGSVYKQYDNSTEGEWTTASYDMSEVSGYTGDIAATKSIDLWFRHGSAVSTGYAELEYIAFFPATEKGKAAWEAFDTVNGAASTVAGTSDKYLNYYEEVNDIIGGIKAAHDEIKDETFAVGAVKSWLEEVVAQETNGMTVTPTVVYSDPTVTATAVTYTVTVHMGAVEQRSIASATLTFKTVADDAITATTLGAQIRKDATDALRFGVKVNVGGIIESFTKNADTYTELSPVAVNGISELKFGMLVVPADAMGETDLTFENLTANGGKYYVGNVEVADVKCTNIFATDDDGFTYTAVVTGIDETGRELIARPYATYKIGETEKVVYFDAITRSVDGVKSALGENEAAAWDK